MKQKFYAKGETLVQQSDKKWKKDHEGIASALFPVKWKSIWSDPPHINSYNTVFWYRLYLHNFNTFDTNTNKKAVCIERSCTNERVTFGHIIWTCRRATYIWRRIISAWVGQYMSHITSFTDNVFGFRHPLPHQRFFQLFKLIGLHCGEVKKIFMSVIDFAWRIICKVTTQLLWKQRNEALYQNKQQSLLESSLVIEMSIQTYFKVIQRYNFCNQDQVRGNLWGIIIKAFDCQMVYVHWPQLHRLHLWCDGGARGNPGVSGSGTIILREKPFSVETELYYYSSFFHLNVETNNFAEYTSLLNGLRNIRARHTTTVKIWSDSQVLVYQIVGRHKKQKNVKLRQVLFEIKEILVELNSFSINHVLRTGNQCADYLANNVMDAKSTQSFVCDMVCSVNSSICKQIDPKIFPLIQVDWRYSRERVEEWEKMSSFRLRGPV